MRTRSVSVGWSVMAKKPLHRLGKILAGLGGGGKEEELLLEGELSRLERFVHFWVLVARSFVRNRCPVRASALSYTTLLALIPMLAVVMSVTSSLLRTEGEDRIEQFIQKFVDSMVPPAGPDTNAPPAATNVAAIDLTGELTNSVAETNLPALATAPANGTNSLARGNARVAAAQKSAAKQIYQFIQNTRSGAIAGTGMVLLVFVAISMLSRIEETFNDIWGVTRGRNWFVRIIQYWAVITLGPLLLIAALGLASGPHWQAARSFLTRMPFVGGFAFRLLPVLVLWLAFTLFYQLVPNTRVRFSAALVGGFVAGLLWFLNNVFGFLYVSRVVTNSKIYGSLGLVPVFMIGLYFSWLILLFGAQVAYAYQNRKLYLQERLAENVNQRGREFVALRVMTYLGQRFHRGLPPPTIPEMTAELAIPSRLVQQVLQTLIAAHLIVEVHGAEPAYTPARPLDNINAHHVLQAMRAIPGQELITRDEPVRQTVYGEFARIQDAERQAAVSITMLALANRAEAHLELAAPPPATDEPTMKPALVPTIPAEPSELRTPSSVVRPPSSELSPPSPSETKPTRAGPSTPTSEEGDFPL